MLLSVYDKKRPKRIFDVVEFFPQNVKIPRVSSTDAAKLAVQDLVETLKQPTPNVLLATINGTHDTAMINVVKLFNVIPKVK